MNLTVVSTAANPKVKAFNTTRTDERLMYNVSLCHLQGSDVLIEKSTTLNCIYKSLNRPVYVYMYETNIESKVE